MLSGMLFIPPTLLTGTRFSQVRTLGRTKSRIEGCGVVNVIASVKDPVMSLLRVRDVAATVATVAPYGMRDGMTDALSVSPTSTPSARNDPEARVSRRMAGVVKVTVSVNVVVRFLLSVTVVAVTAATTALAGIDGDVAMSPRTTPSLMNEPDERTRRVVGGIVMNCTTSSNAVVMFLSIVTVSGFEAVTRLMLTTRARCGMLTEAVSVSPGRTRLSAVAVPNAPAGAINTVVGGAVVKVKFTPENAVVMSLSTVIAVAVTVATLVLAGMAGSPVTTSPTSTRSVT